MIRTTYHTHNRYCDGEGEIAAYAQVAAAAGLAALGVSSHAPLDFPDEAAMRAADLSAYCADVARVRAAWRGRLDVHLALEFDYIPERHDALWALVAAYPFEYLIGSVHFIGTTAGGTPWAYDLTRRGFEDGLRRQFGGEIRRLVGAYYERVRALAAWGRAAIVGHLDRVKKWNDGGRYFREDEPWYVREVEATLQACARADLIVELNTAGWRDAVRSPYPSPWILRRCRARGIRLLVTTDAHTPAQVTDHHADAEALLREAGCTEVAMVHHGAWTTAPLDG